MRASSKPTLPFVLDRKVAKGLVDQAIEGIRSAIVGGVYAAGAHLPSQSEFAKAARVSLKVPRLAYERLAREGWVLRRPGLGYIVATPTAHVWKGRVLVVCVNRGNYIWLANIGLDRKLTAAGYLVSYAFVMDDVRNTSLYASLDSALSVCRYDIILSFDARDDLISRFENSKTPYVVNIPHRRYKRCTLGAYHRGSVFRDEASAETLTQAVESAGVRTVAWVDYQDVYSPFAARLRRSGMKLDFWQTPYDAPRPTPAAVRTGACRAFQGWLGKDGRKLPDLFLFTDDCVADGALTAMALLGIDVPKDVRVVTLVNVGTGLAYPRNFTRLEVDAERDGEAMAEYLLDCRSARKLKPPLRVSPRFVAGVTL